MAVLCVGVAGAVFAGSLFTDVSQHTAPGMVTQINSALDALEDSIDGTSKINGSFQDLAVAGTGAVTSNLTVNGNATLGNATTDVQQVIGETTLIGRLYIMSGGVSNQIDNGAGRLDGEVLADDSVDDDSIDFADVTGGDLTLTDCGAIAGTTLTATGASTLAAVTASGLLTVSNSVYLGHPSVWKTITFDGSRIDTVTALGAVTNNYVISGLGNINTVAPAGTVTNTIAVPTAAGRTLTVINIAAQDWILSDAGTVKLAGEATLNQYDSITLRAIDTSSWVEVSRSNN